MRPDTIAAIAERIAATRDGRARTRSAVLSGDWTAAEDNPTRRDAYDARVAKAAGVPESIQESNDFQPAAFLADGAAVRRAVARVLVQTQSESTSGTGFLITPDLFITNQHVPAKQSEGGTHLARMFDAILAIGVAATQN